MKRALRFAFDVGTNSIGWALLSGADPGGGEPDQGQKFELESVVAAGARVFSDGRNPKDGSSLAEMRRVPRGARRRRDRFLQRKRKLTRNLVRHGLAPVEAHEAKALDRLDPYELRVRALDEALTPYEIGRVLQHLNQRRGFKSNRKTDAADKNKGPLKEAMARLRENLRESGARTLGEFLARRRATGARFRPSADPKLLFEHYPTRELAEAEFDAIWTAQTAHHPELLTEGARTALRETIFHQRPLKPVKPGKCTFIPTEERAPKALPSVEARRIYETLNALRYGEGLSLNTPLTLQQRDLLAGRLLEGKNWSFDRIRSGLKLGASVHFSHEATLKEIKGSETAKKISNAKAWGKAWHDLDPETQDRIVELLLEEEQEEKLIATLMAEYNLPEDAARYVANASLTDGYARLGRTANARMLEQLRRDVVTYDAACKLAGFHHSDFRDGVLYDRLPPYQMVLERHTSFGSGEPDDPIDERLGRIANPTVHIGLNQLRKVVNAMIAEYGRPDEIVVELARELKQSTEQKDRDKRDNRLNQQRNEARRAELLRLGLPVNSDNMMRLRLWEEQKDRGSGVALCPYTLRAIDIETLFSGDIDIDHILPVSRTLDDSPANKVVCFRAANRYKRNKSPYEAFGQDNPQPVAAWADIEQNAVRLPPNKAWRFGKNAMEEFNANGRDFLDRQLGETRHLARVAKAYLEKLTPDVWVVTGRLTSLLRRKWGLESILSGHNIPDPDLPADQAPKLRKNRDDHRHHAVDAIVIGCTSRSLLQRVATNAARAEEAGIDRVFSDLPEPMPDFREQVSDAIAKVIVSHKPEHGKGGALHEDTAYGIVRNGDRDIGNLVYRKALDALTLKEAERVRDPNLREAILNVRAESGGDQKAFTAKLRDWAKAEAESVAARTGKLRQPLRRVRILKPEASAVEIADRRTGAPYKALVPGENYCVDIVQMRDGSWKGITASRFEVARKTWRPKWEREKLGGKLVMRLMKGDLIEIDEGGARAIKRVVRIEPSNNRVRLAGHLEAGTLGDRNNDKGDTFRWDYATYPALRVRKAHKVTINEIGRIKPCRSNVASKT